MANLKNTKINDTGFLQIPTGSSAQRPSNPTNGEIRYNSELKFVEQYDVEYDLWFPAGFVPPIATGGTVTDITQDGVNYRVHTFTSVGTSTFAVTRSGPVEYLIVAGGGSGGGNNRNGGGGGAGGLLTGITTVTAQPYTITVGDGGQALGVNQRSAPGISGDNSSAFGLTAIGGGHGGSWVSQLPASGGSGGGGGSHTGTTVVGGTGTPGQGNSGGTNAVGSDGRSGGGGGGAGSPGPDAVFDQGANGGIGISTSISGTATFYAGGGAAGRRNGSGLSTFGGQGGGGNFVFGIQRFNGTPSTGGGGGATGLDNDDQLPGDGGSGIVIIRYRTS